MLVDLVFTKHITPEKGVRASLGGEWVRAVVVEDRQEDACDLRMGTDRGKRRSRGDNQAEWNREKQISCVL
jgi:hypothetical protein